MDMNHLTVIAMVHKIRKEETRSAVVYGCCSDGYSFSFFRMDKDSQVRLFLTLANTYIYIKLPHRSLPGATRTQI